MYKVSLVAYISRKYDLTADTSLYFDTETEAMTFAGKMIREDSVTAVTVTNEETAAVIYEWEEIGLALRAI